MVIFGHSYLFVTISLATDAHSSPRKNAGGVLSLGWFENRADIAQTERMRTGGNVPALHSWSDAYPMVGLYSHWDIPKLPHVTWLV